MPLTKEIPNLEEELIDRINEIIEKGGWKKTAENRPVKPSKLDIFSAPDPNKVRTFSFKYQTAMGEVKAVAKAKTNMVELELKGAFGNKTKKFKVTRYAYLSENHTRVRFKNKDDLVGEMHFLMVYFSPVNNLKLQPKQIEKLRIDRAKNPMAPPPPGLPPPLLNQLLSMPQQPMDMGGPLPPMEMQQPFPGQMGTDPMMMQQLQQQQMMGQQPMQGQQPMPGQQPVPSQQQGAPGEGTPQQENRPLSSKKEQVPKIDECPQCGSPLGEPENDGTYSCQFCGAIIEP